MEKNHDSTYKRLNKNNAALLLVDHQSGLISLVQDFTPDDFKNSVITLADIGKFFKLPTILTTSFDEGPNGSIVPEILERFPDTPFIHRPGQINAWDNEDFVKAVKATGRKQLIFAGVVTDVCGTFPTLSAIEEGFDVFVVTDASGTFNTTVQQAAWNRMSKEYRAVAQQLSRLSRIDAGSDNSLRWSGIDPLLCGQTVFRHGFCDELPGGGQYVTDSRRLHVSLHPAFQHLIPPAA